MAPDLNPAGEDAAKDLAAVSSNESELIANADGLKWALGFAVRIGSHRFTVEPQDFAEISRGTYEIKLPADETRDIGSLRGFYEDIDDFLEGKLPNPEWDRFEDPLGSLVDAKLTLTEFHLKLVDAAVMRVHVDVTVAANYKVPGIKLEVESLRFQVTYVPPAQ